jgi:hypothetical protein
MICWLVTVGLKIALIGRIGSGMLVRGLEPAVHGRGGNGLQRNVLDGL